MAAVHRSEEFVVSLLNWNDWDRKRKLFIYLDTELRKLYHVDLISFRPLGGCVFPNWAISGAIAFFVFALLPLSLGHLSHKFAFSSKWKISIRVWLTFHEVWPVSLRVGSPNWSSAIDLSTRAAIFLPHISDQYIVVFISETLAITTVVSALSWVCQQVVILLLTHVPAARHVPATSVAWPIMCTVRGGHL